VLLASTEKEGACEHQFFISVAHIKKAGFHRPVSEKEAKEILSYLIKGDNAIELPHEDCLVQIEALRKENTPWEFAQILLLPAGTKAPESPRGNSGKPQNVQRKVLFRNLFLS